MNSNEKWRLSVDDKVFKTTRRFPSKDRDRLEQVIDNLIENPHFGDIEKMKGEDAWRRRIGRYRIFYEIISKEKTIYVFDIKLRTSTTY